MKEFTYIITDPSGIHARPAGLLVKAAKKFEAGIFVEKGYAAHEKGGFEKDFYGHGSWGKAGRND